ncbi:MAG: NAD-binding protein [Abditibacteriales bacterium]|nr:NAD-binding protein [Abditibacteriales bacterium]MDW8366673.1 NAD-binding protein [Abditibacteriales bacterium]
MMSGHFIVCGMGQVGYRVVALLRRLGESVTVITQTTRDEWLHAGGMRGVTVLTGDARDPQLLAAADVQNARALIAVTNHDLVNIEIALDAKQLRPDLPVVVRLFDQVLAHQLEASFDIRRALAMSTLAAPTFAAAAMGEQIVGSFTLDETLFMIGQLTLNEASPLAHLTVREVGAKYRLAVLHRERDEADVSLVPSPDTVLHVGDRVTVVGCASDWEKVTPDSAPPVTMTSLVRQCTDFVGHHLHPAFWFDFVRQVWRNTPMPLRVVFVTINLLTFLSVFVFHFAMNLSLVDALYFIIATVTTVGYGDITPRHASPVLKLYGCLVMLLGSATVAVLYSIITDFIVTARFQQVLGRQRVPQEGHIVVMGLGNVGYRIVDELRRVGARLIAIERNADGAFVEAVRAHLPVIIGDARMRETLVKAGVAQARAVIAATNDDAVNLSIGLTAKQMNPRLRSVVRLFDADFARKVQATLNIDFAISAPALAAPTFVAAALYPDVRDAFVLDNRLLIVLLHRTVGDDWHGLTPSHLRATHSVIVLLRKRPPDAYGLAHDDAPLDRQEEVLAVVWRRLS